MITPSSVTVADKTMFTFVLFVPVMVRKTVFTTGLVMFTTGNSFVPTSSMVTSVLLPPMIV